MIFVIDEYSVVYDNELSANYALEKLNKFKTSSSRYDTITLEKKIDIRQELIKKLDENNSKSSLSYVEYFLSQLKNQPTSISNVTQLISKENVNKHLFDFLNLYNLIFY